MASSTHSGRALLWAVSGTFVWLICFAVMYGGLSVACASPLAGATIGPVNAVTVAVMALWLAHAVVLGLMIRVAWRNLQAPGLSEAQQASASDGDMPAEASRFMAKLALFLHVGSAVALLVLALPVLVLVPCL